MVNEHITSLGYTLEAPEEPNVEVLLRACKMDPMADPPDGWQPHKFLVATTLAGGLAACVGWNRHENAVVLHSLAVAPSSRGSGIGAGLLATAMAQIMEEAAVPAIYLSTASSGAARLFNSTGFQTTERDDLPELVGEHPSFHMEPERSWPMVRSYDSPKRGLDNCAFRLITNDTEDATLPLGSVFFFRQTGEVIESSYRGGPVRRGHIIGAISGDELNFCWHQYVDDGRLQSGDGTIFVELLEDGRRELRETLSTAMTSKTNELLLREL